MTCLCFPPIVEDLAFTQFGPWSWWQVIRLLFHRTGQEPKIVFGRLFHLLSVEEESVRFIMKGRHLRLHMCKILEFCFLPKGFVGMRPRSLYCMRAARSARTL
ncbi:hypothetical protein RISW2_09235 [Roseivivax isoporae LMG 25204]|uniref:Uncharacterized protein n=1 Tax=Roseivivax isoporae LMG 25204 TaxID=1449351 RepID=X7F7R1_9RHOB|nr:hypothetical protein RISW2_09235 [Roseivivax isoporae LMG 25204]